MTWIRRGLPLSRCGRPALASRSHSACEDSPWAGLSVARCPHLPRVARQLCREQLLLLTDRPDEASEFSRQGGHGLLFVLAAARELPIPRVQSQLSTPRDLTYLVRSGLIPRPDHWAECRTEPICPRGFNEHSPHVSVPGASDAPSALAVATRALRWYEPEIAHESWRPQKPPQVAELRRYDDRCYEADA